MKTSFHNGRIFTGTEFLRHAIVEVDGDTITAVGAQQTSATDAIDLQGGLLAPAFINIQIYGGNDQLFGEHPSVDALKATVEYSLSGGATHILPTVATNSQQVVNAAIQAVREYWQQGLPGVIGLHLEGPFINAAKRGAHIAEFIKKPSLKDAEELIRPGIGVIKMMTLAPEVCSPEVISYLQQQNIIISAGHTDATFEQATTAFSNNIHLATHLFNAMSPLQHRAPGTVGAILNSSHVHASIIADGHHVDYPAIAIAKKIMGERLFLITDAVAKNTSGVYQHQLQGDKYVVQDGTLSGSALTMLKAVRNCMDHVNISLEEALKMASLYPARVLKLEHQLGSIAKDYKAELIWLDEQLQLKGVYANGSFTRLGIGA
jgi:N-acetylglucosamine-6-phosphate deacetylase